MATKNEYGEALKGMGVIPPSQGIYEMSSAQVCTLGHRIAFADGRVFRYAKAGAVALAPGKFVKAGHTNHSINTVVNAAVAVGNNNVVVRTGAACTTGAEGYLQTNDAAGEGHLYKIKTTAANSTTVAYTDVTLYDPIATALVAATSEVSILSNPYEQCEIVSAAGELVVGVPPITVTAEYYFWLQTWGLASVLSNNTPTAGYVVYPSFSDDIGGTTIYNAALNSGLTGSSVPIQAAGIQWLVGVDTEYKPVYLMICP